MKTTDLIPIILYQLVDGDKYGYEIVKQIEESSNGGIIIKQPTLYSVLKKLEQGRFISSYWQDSEIGGKRHYYKLTDNGKQQLETYPPFTTLIKDILESEGVNTGITSPVSENSNSNFESQPVQDISKADEIIDDSLITDGTNTISPSPIDLTTTFTNINNSIVEPMVNEELDISNTTDSQSDLTINIQEDIPTYSIEIERPNSNDLFNEDDKITTTSSINIFDAIDFSSSDNGIGENNLSEMTNIEDNSNVNQYIENETSPTMFTEKVEPIVENPSPNKLYDKLSPNTELITQVENQPIDTDSSYIAPIEQIKFLNYVDFSNDKSVIKRKKTISKHIQKMSATCISLLVMFIISLIACSKYSFSNVYYISAIIVCLILILYPIILLVNISKLRLKYCTRPFKYSISRDFFIKLSLFLSLTIIIFSYNLTISTNISTIFSLSNFANFIAPVMLGSVVVLDFVYNVLFYKKYTR
ncbi:MAG: PadR family transcriptional regulator [Clostridia bacterium]|nr:PadR family transcriptional regulator [Clostridia bacterium]